MQQQHLEEWDKLLSDVGPKRNAEFQTAPSWELVPGLGCAFTGHQEPRTMANIAEPEMFQRLLTHTSEQIADGEEAGLHAKYSSRAAVRETKATRRAAFDLRQTVLNTYPNADVTTDTTKGSVLLLLHP